MKALLAALMLTPITTLSVASEKVSSGLNSCLCLLSTTSVSLCAVDKAQDVEWLNINMGLSLPSEGGAVGFDHFVSACAKEPAQAIGKTYFATSPDKVVLTWETSADSHISLFEARQGILINQLTMSTMLSDEVQVKETLALMKDYIERESAECEKIASPMRCKQLIKRYSEFLTSLETN